MERVKIIDLVCTHLESLNEIGINKVLDMAGDLCLLPEYHRDTTPEQCEEIRERNRLEIEFKTHQKFTVEASRYEELTNEQYRKELAAIFQRIEDNRILSFFYVFISEMLTGKGLFAEGWCE